MALSGIEIFKFLPKTNCKECGVPTCLAFAMSLAQGKAELTACPYVSDEAKEKLSVASAPPIRTVTIGAGDKAQKAGGETVLFRHEKTFFNAPGLAILITDAMDDAEVEARVSRADKLEYERVGLTLRGNLVALKAASGDASKFEALVNKVKGLTDLPIILITDDPAVMGAGAKACADRKPLLYGATAANADAMAGLAKELSCPLGVRGENIDDLAAVSQKLIDAGLKDLVIDSGARKMNTALTDHLAIRRLALQKQFKPFGFPTITFPCEMTDDPMMETMYASTFINKYGGYIVLSDFQDQNLFPLLLNRLNIYTDPQRPMATKQGIYEIGTPTEESPVLITTNFSLTYFIVSGEIETSRVPGYLMVLDTEGLSVMTAWAAGKFAADLIATFVKKSGITDKVKHTKLIIPGYAAGMSGELEEELPDWKIIIGPRDGSHIPAMLKEMSA